MGLSKQQATTYISDFAMADKNSDGNISETEFQDGCKKGSVRAGQTNSCPYLGGPDRVGGTLAWGRLAAAAYEEAPATGGTLGASPVPVYGGTYDGSEHPRHACFSTNFM